MAGLLGPVIHNLNVSRLHKHRHAKNTEWEQERENNDIWASEHITASFTVSQDLEDSIWNDS